MLILSLIVSYFSSFSPHFLSSSRPDGFGVTSAVASLGVPAPQATDKAVVTGFSSSEADEPTNALPASLPASYKDMKLFPGGIPFGVKFYTDGIVVIGLSDIDTERGRENPGFDAGLREKDIIKKINGLPLKNAAQFTEAVDQSDGKSLTLTCTRAGKEFTAHITPKYSPAENRYKTGLWIRDSGAGIGTVTFIQPKTLSFGGLGHGICDTDTGALIPMEKGSVLDVTISGVNKGVPGTPGEIQGYFSSGKIGTLIGNTSCGVYGVYNDLPSGLPEAALPLGTRENLQEGDAWIYCTLDADGPCQYAVRISSINRSATGNKCFSITVTDKKLIEKTGGIVQGMSGSPIIQNGKLVGAVTHVLINDPTAGYGIFIENMLSSMPDMLR